MALQNTAPDEKLPLPFGDLTEFPTINSTGVVRLESEFSISADELKVKIPEFLGFIYDPYTTDITRIEFKEISEYLSPFLTTNNNTYLLISSDGEIQAQITEPTESEREENIYLVEIQHPQGLVTQVIQHFDYVTQQSNTTGEIVKFLDPIIRGLRLEPVAGTLQLNRKAGSIMLKNVGDELKPSVTDLDPVIPMQFQYVLNNGVRIGGTTTIVDPNRYDNAGTLTVVPVGLVTIQRVAIGYNKAELIQYGNQTYADFNSALKAFDDIESIFPSEVGIGEGAVIGYLLVLQGATDLSLTTNAVIAPVNNFCEANNPETAGVLMNTSVPTGALIATNNLSDVTNVVTSRTNLGAGAANGLAQLDATGIVPTSQLPPDLQVYGVLQRILVNNGTTGYNDVIHLPIISSFYTGYDTVNFILFVEIPDRHLEYRVEEEVGTSLLAAGTFTTGGHKTISFLRPIGDVLIKLAVRKTDPGGISPIIKGITVRFST